MEKTGRNIEKFKIAILEDSPFYNLLLKKQFDDYFENVGVISNQVFSIKTFTNTSDFMKNLSPDTDVVLLDFYLEEGQTALSILEKIRQTAISCKVIIISSAKNVQSSYKSLWRQAVDFIFKDETAPVRTCKAIEAIFSQKTQN